MLDDQFDVYNTSFQLKHRISSISVRKSSYLSVVQSNTDHLTSQASASQLSSEMIAHCERVLGGFYQSLRPLTNND
jgi:hypothetical protein